MVMVQWERKNSNKWWKRTERSSIKIRPRYSSANSNKMQTNKWPMKVDVSYTLDQLDSFFWDSALDFVEAIKELHDNVKFHQDVSSMFASSDFSIKNLITMTVIGTQKAPDQFCFWRRRVWIEESLTERLLYPHHWLRVRQWNMLHRIKVASFNSTLQPLSRTL